jgi:two-component system chemotaxis response regulator CheB
MEKTTVIIVDDSAVVRQLMTECLKDTDIEVLATAIDPYVAADKIMKFHPDVITLDIEMPRMDGLTFLKKLMSLKPMPVIMVSSLTDKGAKETIMALEYGAADFILKPKHMEDPEAKNSFKEMLAEKIHMAKNMKIRSRAPREIRSELVKSVPIPSKQESSRNLIAIGASTGGTEVIEDILTEMEPDCPGIVITQHMPPKFTEAFANRIDSLSKIHVAEAKDGDRVTTGTALIAPGGLQMKVKQDKNGYFVEVKDDPPVNRHKPSVDVLFNSVAESAAGNALGVILTGMGADGARGLLAMKESGSITLAQDEKSCVVFGMPKEAIKLGGAVNVLNVEEIISYMKKKSFRT